jgi:hypothetical protein
MSSSGVKAKFTEETKLYLELAAACGPEFEYGTCNNLLKCDAV